VPVAARADVCIAGSWIVFSRLLDSKNSILIFHIGPVACSRDTMRPHRSSPKTRQAEIPLDLVPTQWADSGSRL
jgi:hypothetical protein